ncbi:unnamed protein product [Urochloa humidicola]
MARSCAACGGVDPRGGRWCGELSAAEGHDGGHSELRWTKSSRFGAAPLRKDGCGGVLSCSYTRQDRRGSVGDRGGGGQERVREGDAASPAREGTATAGASANDEGRHGGEACTEIRIEGGGGVVHVEGRGDDGIAKRAWAWGWRGGRCGHDVAEGRRLG